MDQQEAKTLVFFDCETTGLFHRGLPKKPPEEQARITEIALQAVTRRHFEYCVDKGLEEERIGKKTEDGFRVVRSLSIPINPGKETFFNPQAKQASGLNWELLEDCSDFFEAWPLMVDFFRDLPKPICLVAHNGDRFDFPLLLDEMSRYTLAPLVLQPDQLYSVDSIPVFKAVDSRKATNEVDQLPAALAMEMSQSPTSTKTAFGNEILRFLGPTGMELDKSEGFTTPKQNHEITPPETPQKKVQYTINGGPLQTDFHTPVRSQENVGGCSNYQKPSARRELFPESPNVKKQPNKLLRKSYALGNLYVECFDSPLPGHHQALADTEALMKVAKCYGHEFLRVLDLMKKPYPRRFN